ncbi:MAG: histone H1 [Bacteroidetes bacterium]|nr:histone H1 [Bacteroidota bacterium]MBU1678114.1 histone H1 [Bacteroidota bacterium]MBU2506190.1 histone H1 [Bacteroidota bacterium]
MSEKYNQLVQYVQSLDSDVSKFYEKGHAAAGTRLRKGLSELKKMAQDLRNDIQAVKVERKAPK